MSVLSCHAIGDAEQHVRLGERRIGRKNGGQFADVFLCVRTARERSASIRFNCSARGTGAELDWGAAIERASALAIITTNAASSNAVGP